MTFWGKPGLGTDSQYVTQWEYQTAWVHCFP